MSKLVDRTPPLWIVAHRGANREAPENTRVAFDAALIHPIDGIELDVQMSKDGVPVLYHDRTLAKIKGGRKRIADFSHQELRQSDWGGWFSDAFRGERILTLDEVLQLYGEQTRLLIEIKSRDKDRRSGMSRALTSCTLELLKKRVPSAYTENIFILSFDAEVLRSAYSQAAGWKYVLNVSDPFSVTKQHRSELDGLYAYGVPIRRLTKEFVDMAHTQGQCVMTYSCNVPQQVTKALNLNVDVMLTDKPGWLVGYLKHLCSHLQ